ncbi:MAG: lysophospholipid acyltransferase family protein [Myxococcota bacterium]|nr:lysophospholipid acyltransferase family protein [Myxococcota bacterium]
MIRKIFLGPYQLYTWLVFAPLLFLGTAFWGTATVILAVTIGPRLASRIGGVSWSRLIGYTAPIFVSVMGRENIEKKQSYVIVSNHQSQFDIPLLYGWLGVDFKWVMKQELRKVPALGVACEKVGHIFIDRSNKFKALESIKKAKKNITDGVSVIFFPEGTRSRTGELGAFKMGAFRMALDLDLPILPVTIIGTGKVLPSRSVCMFPGRVKMIIHPPIDTSGLKGSDIRSLMNKTREIIASAQDAPSA